MYFNQYYYNTGGLSEWCHWYSGLLRLSELTEEVINQQIIINTIGYNQLLSAVTINNKCRYSLYTNCFYNNIHSHSHQIHHISNNWLQIQTLFQTFPRTSFIHYLFILYLFSTHNPSFVTIILILIINILHVQWSLWNSFLIPTLVLGVSRIMSFGKFSGRLLCS